MSVIEGVRRADENDAVELVELLSQIHGARRVADYCRWKYDQNPAGRSVSVVAEHDGNIVGHIGGILTRFVVHGEVRIGAQELDIIIDKQYRKSRTFFKMLGYRKQIHHTEPIDFSYGFANDVTSKVSERSPAEFRYRKVASLPRLAKLLDPTPYVERKISFQIAARAASACAKLGLQLLDRSRIDVPEGTQVASVARFDNRFDAFWEQIKCDYPISIVRDQKYLNWRYFDVPGVEHTVLCLERLNSEEVLGYVVMGIRHKGTPRGVILDLVTPRSAQGSLTRVLLAHALQWFRSRGLAVAVCWMYPHCHAYQELKKLGFRVRPKRGNNLMYRGLTDFISPDEAHQESSWFISMGDSDL